MKILLAALSPVYLPQNIKYMLNSWFIAFNQAQDIDAACLISENLQQMDKQSNHLKNLNTISFIYDEYVPETMKLLTEEKLITSTHVPSPLLQIARDTLPENEIERLSKILKEKTQNFVPDIIISYHSGSSLLKKTFPNALLLFMENGIFSRAPFPHTLYLSPYSSFWHAFITKYKDDIMQLPVKDHDINKLIETKKEIKELIERQSPLKNELIKLKEKFRKIILLPLASGGAQVHSKFSTELELLHYVLEKTPKDIGIILTKHDSFKGEPSPEYLKKLQEKYPNLIYFDYLNSLNFASSSLFFMPHIDAIIGLYSGVALMSLLWDVPILSMVEGMHDAYKDEGCIENLDEFFAQKYEAKNTFLYWYLTHYVLFMERLNNSQWNSKYFHEKLSHYKKYGDDFSYYNKKEDIFEICDYLKEYVAEYYLQCGHKDEILLKSYLKDKKIEDMHVFHFAVIKGNLDEAKEILQKNKDLSINIKTKEMQTALHFAAEYGHKEILCYLLENRAYINSRDSNGNTPLHIAAENGQKEIVQILIEYKANKKITNVDGLTAYNKAESKKHLEIIDLLKI